MSLPWLVRLIWLSMVMGGDAFLLLLSGNYCANLSEVRMYGGECPHIALRLMWGLPTDITSPTLLLCFRRRVFCWQI